MRVSRRFQVMAGSMAVVAGALMAVACQRVPVLGPEWATSADDVAKPGGAWVPATRSGCRSARPK